MAVVVNIAADYDSTGVKAAQQAFANFGQTMSKTLAQAAKVARKSLEDVDQAAGDTRTSAQRLAAAIDQTATRLEGDLKASATAADALGRALGPELAAKIGRNGIEQLVSQFTRAGVTLQEITADADVLAAAIQKVDDVNLAGITGQTENLNNGIKQTAVQVDASKQVFASFAGQATTELANVGGSIGSIASGLGQVVVQGVAGRATLADIAAIAGPMAALSVVLLTVKSVVKNIKDTKAWNKDEINAYTKALGETASVSTAVRNRIDEVGGAFVRVNKQVSALSPNGVFKQIFGAYLPIAKETVDVTDKLTALGLTVKDVARFIAGGRPKVDEYVAALERAGVSSSTTGLVSKYLYQQIELTGEAAKAAAVKTQFGIGATDALASSMDATAIAAGAAQVAIDRKAAADEAAAAAAQAAADADRNHANAIDSVREALYRRNNARYASESADNAARDALAEYSKAQDKANKSRKPADIEKANELQRQAEKALNDAAAAASSYAGEQRKYGSETEKAAAQTAAAVAELERLKQKIAPGSELVGTVEQWLLLLRKIPTSVTTVFGISFGSSIPTRTSSSSATSVADTWSANGVFDSLGVPGATTNITVNGAIDPVSTANTIRQVLDRRSQRNGTSG